MYTHRDTQTHTHPTLKKIMFSSKESWCVGVSEAQIHLIFPALGTLSAAKSSIKEMQQSLRSVTENSQGGSLWGKALILENVS